MAEFRKSAALGNKRHALKVQMISLKEGYSVHIIVFIFYFILFFAFKGHTCGKWRIPGQVVELELQPLAYTTAAATQDLSCVCDLHHSSCLNPLSQARDQTRILPDPRWVR